MVSPGVSQGLGFIVNVGSSYLLSRLTAQDGPRLQNLSAAEGDYGVGMPRAYGENVRLPGIFIVQDDIKETEHTVEDYSEIVGALTGAAQGFMIGGPVGAVVGAVIGGLFGAATPDQKYYTYSDTFALLLADRTGEDPVEGISKIWAQGKLIFKAAGAPILSEHFDGDGRLIRRKYGKNKYFKSMAIYTGHTEQFVDGVLANAVDEDGAYPFSAYVMIQDLQLLPWGNAVPTCEILFQPKAGETVAKAAERFCSAAGIDPVRNLSSTALASDVLKGYWLTSETSCWDALKPLLPVFRSSAAEVSGQVRLYKRSQSLRSTISVTDMGAHAYGDTPPERIKFRRGGDLDLPRETSFTFIDPARGYQVNTAVSQRSEGNSQSNVSITLPIVLDAGEGASAAAVMHWDAWLGRTEVEFSLTDGWIGLSVGLAYAIPFGDQFVPYRITQRIRGNNGIIEVRGVSDETITYSASVDATSGTIPPDESTDEADTRLVLMDMPITGDDHDDYGFYVAISATEPDWPRGRIQASSDGTNFVTLIDTSQAAVMGDVTGTLAAGSTTGLDDTLDTTSVLTVELLHSGMVLSSSTDALLDAWANFVYVGKEGLGEYLQFKTATQTGPTTWELTDLRRGRKGTDHALGAHTSGEEFVLLGGSGVFRINYSDDSQWGEELTFRGLTLHQDEVDAEEQTFTNTGEGKRPYSPVNIEGAWDGSDNLTITAEMRSRLNAGGLGIDDNDELEWEILSGTGRVELTAGDTFVYLAADQTSDGITPGDSISGRVRQTSDVNDGRWRNFFLVGPGASGLLHFEDDTTIYSLEDDVAPIELE